jgi:hypothetical protein
VTADWPSPSCTDDDGVDDDKDAMGDAVGVDVTAGYLFIVPTASQFKFA